MYLTSGHSLRSMLPFRERAHLPPSSVVEQHARPRAQQPQLTQAHNLGALPGVDCNLNSQTSLVPGVVFLIVI